MRDLKKQWIELAASGGDSGLSCIRVPGPAWMNAFVSVIKPGNIPAIFFELPLGHFPMVEPIIQSKGFSVDIESFFEGSHGKERIIIRLCNDRYFDMFSVFIGDILESIGSVSTEAAMVSAITGRVSRWRNFMEIARPEGLNGIEQQGLWGEIWFLRQCLIEGIDPRIPVEAWVGQQANNRDFLFGPIGIEVKTTSGNTSGLIRISNIRQLDTTGLQRLFICHISLSSEVDGTGYSLPDIVRDVHKRLSLEGSGIVDIFEDKLAEGGYMISTDSQYVNPKYSIRSVHPYAVREEFPVLTERNVPSGVIEAEYTISVAHCSAYSLEVGSLCSLLKEDIDNHAR